MKSPYLLTKKPFFVFGTREYNSSLCGSWNWVDPWRYIKYQTLFTNILNSLSKTCTARYKYECEYKISSYQIVKSIYSLGYWYSNCLIWRYDPYSIQLTVKVTISFCHFFSIISWAGKSVDLSTHAEVRAQKKVSFKGLHL